MEMKEYDEELTPVHQRTSSDQPIGDTVSGRTLMNSSDESENKKSKQQSLRDSLIEILQTVVMALVLFFIIDSVVARVRVENISMEPTLVPGEFLLVNKLVDGM